MAPVYLVLSEDERRKGFTRPLRESYRHVGIPGPRYPLRDLDAAERGRYADSGFVKFEPYPESERPATGKFWTAVQLESIGNGCGSVTTMGRALAETYAVTPGFYGSTYCCTCRMHLPVGSDGEFIWIESNGSDGPRVGT